MPIRTFLYTSILGCLFISFTSTAQDIKINAWRVHLPYQDGIAVTEGTDRIFAASKAGMFSYNLVDESLERLSKVNGFSDVEVATLRYNREKKILLIAYKSTR